jgi:hypothetical protein
MNEKHKRIIKAVKQNNLYATYRGILNFYLNEYDRKGRILATPIPKHLFDAIKYENTTLLIQLLKKWKLMQPRTEKQIENFKKFYLYKTKCNLLK